MKEIEVNGVVIRLDEEYISLTDIAKQVPDQRSDTTIASWLKNNNTLLFLEEWEIQHNPNFKSKQMLGFIRLAISNRNAVSPSKFIKATDAIGIYSKRGSGGGTYAHPDIALFFCYWLSPPFAVWMIKTFKRLLTEESNRKNLKFHISKITDHIDEARNWLDTIPHQDPDRNRLNPPKSDEPTKDKEE